ncbi:hypothetical protein SAMN05421818_1292 [Myroides phaeus]|uniref:Beta-carotene 15,15'-monooxygenase n=2 Tax=Myroides phaeus TaxID=702745 RepID=A0A1G8GKF4_9FLAO|nr:DUF6097 family protein [Myroides phaeus]MEC4115888.1 DUF6097 family protein [Myroides phaeus]SDH94806.1 hypothetical protein SAMN05421818_1292 [Myroides phaeus]
MKELDLLKKHWNENQNFPKISVQEIHKMIHKKSSSIVMWIFVISIVEFICLNLLSVFYFDSEAENKQETGPVFNFLIEYIDYISVITSVFFIVLFYLNYRKICVADSTKKLMTHILKTKKTVNYYIYTNLGILTIAFLITIIDILTTDLKYSSNITLTIIFMGIILFICATFICIVWLYYKVIYGFLIKKLMKNYKELEKIEYE